MGQPHFATMRGREHEEQGYVDDRSQPSEHLLMACHPKIGALFVKHLLPIIAP